MPTLARRRLPRVSEPWCRTTAWSFQPNPADAGSSGSCNSGVDVRRESQVLIEGYPQIGKGWHGLNRAGLRADGEAVDTREGYVAVVAQCPEQHHLRLAAI